MVVRKGTKQPDGSVTIVEYGLAAKVIGALVLTMIPIVGTAAGFSIWWMMESVRKTTTVEIQQKMMAEVVNKQGVEVAGLAFRMIAAERDIDANRTALDRFNDEVMGRVSEIRSAIGGLLKDIADAKHGRQ